MREFASAFKSLGEFCSAWERLGEFEGVLERMGEYWSIWEGLRELGEKWGFGALGRFSESFGESFGAHGSVCKSLEEFWSV